MASGLALRAGAPSSFCQRARVKAPSLNPPIPHFHFPQPVHHHMSAPEVEERAPHEYEGVGIGRRESLKGDDLPPAHHGEEAAGHATKERAQAPPPPQH